MGKYWGKLRGNKSLALPRHFVFYDAETSPIKQPDGTKKHVLKMGMACYLRRPYGKHKQKEEWLTFYTVKEFWDWLEGLTSSKTKLYLIAHNQQFDALVVDLFRELPKRDWVMRNPIIDSKLFIAYFKKDTKTIVALDSLNWFKFSLKALGEFVGIKKLKIDFDSCTDEELHEYCRSDVEILKEAMLKWVEFVKGHDLGSFKYTIASQSFTAYRHRFMKHPIFIHNHEPVTRLERESYRGGRNEAYQLGAIPEHVTLVDFNSLYPAMMVDNYYPTKLIAHIEHPTKDGFLRAMRNFLVIAKVNITVTRPAIALKRERLVFPIGTFTTTLTSPELLYVLDHEKLNKVLEYVIYEYAPIFHDYVKEWYELRQVYKKQTDKVGDLLTKLMLNTLYGKYGQRITEQELIGTCDPDEIAVERHIIYETGERFMIKYFGGNVYKVHRTLKESRNSFPAIASYVTAYGRMEMWKAMLKAGRENVYYVDTDSLFVNDTGLKKLDSLIDEKKLGKLKVEGSGTDLFINGLKDYLFLNKTKIKGVKKDAKLIGLSAYQQTHFLKVRSLIRKGFLDAPVETEMIKHLKREYKKGVVGEDYRITPFVLAE